MKLQKKIAPALTLLFQASLDQGVVESLPGRCRSAVHAVANYRPISLITFFASYVNTIHVISGQGEVKYLLTPI